MKKLIFRKNKVTSFLSCFIGLTIMTGVFSACSSSNDSNKESAQDKTKQACSLRRSLCKQRA